ncbi:hypothetical protein JST97_32810, partial [bacterium]|nr:hypothetical protein [bacterium]
AGNFDVRTSVNGLNITAGQSLAINPSSGYTNFQADNGGGVSLTSPSLSLRGTEVFVSAPGDINLRATSGDALLRSSSNRVSLTSNNGAVLINAAQDLLLQAGGTLVLQSATGTNLNATRDLNLSSTTTSYNGPQTTWTAGRNLNESAIDVGPSLGAGNLTLNASNVSITTPGANGFALRAGNFTVNASQDFVASTTGGNFDVRTSVNGVNVSAGGNVQISASGSKSITANADQLTISGGNVALSGVSLTANSNAPLRLTSAGNLSVGPLSSSPGANVTLSGANITIDSMQNISGGNYTINTPGNLTEVTAATNPPTLAGLNISAGRVFNTGSGNGKFSIPNVSTPGALAALVTAGNDSGFNSSASFQTFNSATLNPGHIDHQTGDIYVNGVLVYGGLPPVLPPDPPPSPPPVPTVTPAPTVTAPQQQQDLLTPEQRAQILAQSNLALGNLGSFSRELSQSERAQLSARMDSLHQTWPLDPFSPTLALTVPGGVPPVLASELAQLQALLLMSSPGDDPLEKDRAAYNVIVDQELREIWEIRYWRHLLEGFIIWEDRE